MPLTSRDISVSIYSDDQELTPYGIEADEETRTVVAYIASTAGKTFEIRVDSLEVVRMPTIVKFFVDGSDARTRAVLPGKPYQDRIYQARISDALVVPMSFSEYDLVDPDETAAARDTRDLGTIQVLFYETSVRPIPQKRDNYAHGEEAEYRDIKDFSHVAETSKKAGGHRVVFDREKAVREKLPAVSRLYPVDTSKRTPFCSFRFFYQPKDLLMAKGIIPRPTLTQVSAASPDPRAFSISASPEPPRAAPSSSTVPQKRIKSDEDAQPGNTLHKSERKRRILDLEAELNALRAADEEVTGVKREGPPSPICVGDADGEVIDLTGDD